MHISESLKSRIFLVVRNRLKSFIYKFLVYLDRLPLFSHIHSLNLNEKWGWGFRINAEENLGKDMSIGHSRFPGRWWFILLSFELWHSEFVRWYVEIKCQLDATEVFICRSYLGGFQSYCGTCCFRCNILRVWHTDFVVRFENLAYWLHCKVWISNDGEDPYFLLTVCDTV